MPVIANLAIMLTANGGQLFQTLDSAKKRISAFAGVGSRGMFGGMSVGAAGTTAAVAGLGIGVAALGIKAIKTAADFERTEVTLTTMTGSAAKAAEVIARLTDISTRTPFEFAGILEGTQRLMAFGFTADDSIALMERLGDLAAANPTGMAEGLQRMTIAIGQMRSRGKVLANEMNQLTEVGIPAWEALAKKMNVDVGAAMDMVTSGTVSARTGIESLLDLASSPKYAGLMEKQSRTLSGMWSNLSDQMQLAFRDVGLAIIEGFDLKNTVRQISTFIQMVRDNFGGLRVAIMRVGAFFSGMKDMAVAALTQIVYSINSWMGSLDNSKGTMQAWKDAGIRLFEFILKKMNDVAIGAIGMAKSMINAFGNVLWHISAMVDKAPKASEWLYGKETVKGLALELRQVSHMMLNAGGSLQKMQDSMAMNDTLISGWAQMAHKGNLALAMANANAGQMAMNTKASAVNLSSLGGELNKGKDDKAKIEKREVRGPEAFMAKSSGAVNAILKSQLERGNDPQAKLKRALDAQLQMQGRQLAEQQRTNRLLSGNSGPNIAVVPESGNF